MLGGKGAYARGGWRGSILEEFLPVRVSEDTWDIARVRDGRLRRGSAHWITADVKPAARARARFVHKIRGVKPGATVILKAGERPFLVVWEKGACRVACILGTPYGSPDDEYFGSEGWPDIVERTMLWLGRRDSGRNE